MLSIFKIKFVKFRNIRRKIQEGNTDPLVPLKGGKVGVGGTGHHVVDEGEVLVYVLCGPRGVVVVQQAL